MQELALAVEPPIRGMRETYLRICFYERYKALSVSPELPPCLIYVAKITLRLTDSGVWPTLCLLPALSSDLDRKHAQHYLTICYTGEPIDCWLAYANMPVCV